jgi:hypothetical protein
MKKAIFIPLAGLSLLLIIGFVAEGLTSFNYEVTTPPVKTSVDVARAKTPLPTEMNISTTGTPLLPYEVLSPTKIKTDKLTFEASIELLNCAELNFLVNGTFPSDFSLSSPGSGDPPIFTNVELISSPLNISLKADPSFGGGGGSDINNLHMRVKDQVILSTLH